MSAIDDVRAGRTEIRWGERHPHFYGKADDSWRSLGYIKSLFSFSLIYGEGKFLLVTSHDFDMFFLAFRKEMGETRDGVEFPTEEEAKAYAQKFYDHFVVEIEARQKEGAGR